jgi:hypothetical protein
MLPHIMERTVGLTTSMKVGDLIAARFLIMHIAEISIQCSLIIYHCVLKPEFTDICPQH